MGELLVQRDGLGRLGRRARLDGGRLQPQSGNLRIVRFDQLPADGRRLPVPDAKAREAALPVVRGLIGDAEAKTAPLDASCRPSICSAKKRRRNSKTLRCGTRPSTQRAASRPRLEIYPARTKRSKI